MIPDTSGQDVQRQPKGTRRWRRVITAVIATAALLLSGGYLWASYGQAQQSVKASRLQFATVERGEMIREVTARGRIVAANAPVLYSTASGRIELMVQAGEVVELNQLLAQIDSPELSAELSQQQALYDSMELDLQRRVLQARRSELELKQRLDHARVTLVAAEREKRRADKAADKDLISDIDHQQAQDEFASARIAFDHAEREMALAQDTLKFEQRTAEVELRRQQLQVAELQRRVEALQLRSPLAGLVGNTLVEDREQIADSQPLMSVVSLTEYQAELEVPESYGGELALGLPVALEISGRTLAGQIAGISPEIIANQVAVRVRFDPNTAQAPLKLRQNQRLNARIQLEYLEDVLMLRRGPFIKAYQGRYGMKVDGNLAQKVPLQLGASSLTHIQILAGAEPGDRFILTELDLLPGSSDVLIK
ncbi:efflux RND transporter periplasmic adaptor subunit [Ferrimonas marina]|uniref:HlyD family secretion protein n=1 Tax=Ferrimonas marina TaxID=299255 RepID=A0A1M5YTR2_9GAMM|nr:HlyD family efflux transporter periplasmic adaptor subunit [Ferrimonas marina]SHI15228.1 HlyD family secretion protein [Ferrimonas marina]